MLVPGRPGAVAAAPAAAAAGGPAPRGKRHVSNRALVRKRTPGGEARGERPT